MMERATVLETLLRALPDAASMIARVLQKFEEFAPYGERTQRSTFDEVWDFRAVTRKHPKAARSIMSAISAFLTKHPYLGERDEVASRYYRIAMFAWKEQVTKLATARPNVMRIACDCLSNPSDPVSAEAVKFALLLLLRRLYGLDYNEENIDKLQVAYRNLRKRFEQRARRIRKAADEFEHYLIDISCFDGHMRLVLTGRNLDAYYNGFKRYPLGVDPESKTRPFEAGDKELPQIKGDVPAFPYIMDVSFGQPFCMPGFDEIVWGALPTLSSSAGRSGGFISLIAGPPGTGKTSFCLSVTSKMAELGSSVRYITTEEGSSGLLLKQTSLGSKHALANAVFPDSASSFTQELDFAVVQGSAFNTLEEIATQLEIEIENEPQLQALTSSPRLRIKLPFPRVVVVDSLTVLLHQAEQTGDPKSYRRTLAQTLIQLRDLGVAVFLIGSDRDAEDQGLAFLVDNVFKMDVDRERAPEHPLRTVGVEKTRFQSSNRGNHILHLSRHHGFAVSPSLHTVIRGTHEQEHSVPDPTRRVHVYTPTVNPQLSLPFEESNSTPLTIRSRAHTLLYGFGSTSKAKMALSLAFEPRVYSHRLTPSMIERSKRPAAYARWLEECRVLVVSFLYKREYYERIVNSMLRQRLKRTPTDDLVAEKLQVVDFYPGYVDPETVVATVRKRLESARLDGRPYSAVVVDGLHNVLLQFPLLQKEPLLWPAMYSVLRQQGVDVISTFTLFALPIADEGLSPIKSRFEHATVSDALFHLLVSACDYSFSLRRAIDDPEAKQQLSLRTLSDAVTVRLESSIDSLFLERKFYWDPTTFGPAERRGRRLRARSAVQEVFS